MTFLDQLRNGIESRSADETIEIGRSLASVIPENRVIALHGDLGVGKTTLIKGLAKSWEIAETITSPTFNLYTIYEGSRQLIHLDAYRLSSDADLDALMIEDFLKPPWCFAIEWPERIDGALPANAWHLNLSITSTDNHEIRFVGEPD